MIGRLFFNESNKQSLVKTVIVSKYFDTWAKVIIGAQNKLASGTDHKIAYIDLFAGPGRFNDGTISTPLKILETAVQNSEMRNRLVTFFNDKDKDNSNNLKNSIHELPGIDLLKYPPDVYTSEIDSEIVTLFEKMRLIPTFLFVDPWGYKGLSSRLVNSVVKDWGCDCVFFFNYNRINMGLNNDMVREHMDALFGLNKVESTPKSLVFTW